MTLVDGRQWFQQYLDRYRDDPEYVLEGVVLDLTDQIAVAMQEQGVSRAELAERLGVSRAYITKVLGGSTNMTLRTLVRLALALGLVPEVSLVPLEADEGAPEAEPAERVKVGS